MSRVGNLAFCIFAGLGSLVVVGFAAANGIWVVAGIWALLAIGFVVRGSESLRRGP